MEAFIVEINAWAWGVPMQVLLLGTGGFPHAWLGVSDVAPTWVCLSVAAGGFRGRVREISPLSGR